MTVKILTKHHLEFLSLKGGCTGSSESTLVKMPHCWESHVTAQLYCIEVDLRVDTSVVAIYGIFTCTCSVTADFPTIALIIELSLVDTLI